MRFSDTVLAAWQKCPAKWRSWAVSSKAAPALRRAMNRWYPTEPRVFALAAPLEGYSMRLEWQSSKAFVFGTYEHEVVKTLLNLVQEKWLALDIGAHIGYFALLLSKLVGPQGKVIAFEPVPDNFRALEENVEMNRCSNVQLENCAVSSAPGNVTMRSNDANHLSYTASMFHGEPVAEVGAIRLDDYSATLSKPVQLVMMDVEGAELSILDGAERLLRRDSPILLIELHETGEEGRVHPVIERLHSLNYSVHFIDGQGMCGHILAEPNPGETGQVETLRQ